MTLTHEDAAIIAHSPGRIRVTVPRFSYTYCSQCGASFGPGDHGISHCWDHPGKRERMALEYRLIVGYDPIADDPTITNAELAALLDDVKDAHSQPTRAQPEES